MVLVALCFVAVLGIALSSYLAVCSRAMNLSNRNFQNALSRQLTESGMDEALRAFNDNDWTKWSTPPTGISDPNDWSIDSTYKRATRTISIASSRLGQGVTATIKLRVDNYDAAHLGATWSSATTYRLNDLIGYNGVWYRSVQNSNTGNQPADSSQYPNLAWWVPAPIRWTWNTNTTYSEYDLVNYNGTWYRYINSSATSGNAVSNTSYWMTVPKLALGWSSGTSYPFGTIIYYSGAWYFSFTRGGSATTAAPTDTNYWAPVISSAGAESAPTGSTYNVGDTFYVGDYIYRTGDKWYRCVATQPYTYVSGDYADTDKWVASKPIIAWCYQTSATYAFNDTVYYRNASGTDLWYRRDVTSAATGTSNSAVPTHTTYWQPALSGDNTTTGAGVQGWSSSSVVYQPGDIVYYYGNSTSQWFRCIKSHTSTTGLTPTNTTYWTGTPRYSAEWESNRQYGLYDQARYKGIWFLSLTASNTGNLPMESNSSNWAAAPLTVTTWSSTTNYDLDDIVSSSGTWYRCIRPNTNQATSSTTYWWPLTGAGSSYVWSGATSYSSGQYRSYGGVWYKCIATTTANAGHTPDNTTYWTAAWASPTATSWGLTTGAPVIYAEATVTMGGDNTSTRTQIRALIAPAPLFPNAAGSNTTLTIGSSGGVVDSYDGSVRAINTDGSYDTFDYDDQTNSPFSASNPNKGYGAVLAASSTATSAITISNTTTVNGFLAQPTPGASISTNTTVWGYGSPASPKVDTSRVSRSPYIPAFDILQAAGSGQNYLRGRALPTTATTSGSTTDNTLNIGTAGGVGAARYYSNGNLNIGTGYFMNTLNINGPVILHINGGLLIRSGGIININPTGLLIVRCTYTRFYTGSHGINNRTLDPKKLLIAGDTALTTTASLDNGASATNNNFYGVIYLPNTTATFGLDVKTGVNFYGAISAREVTFTAESDLHYDTSLRYATFLTVDQPYTITDWRTLESTSPATMP